MVLHFFCKIFAARSGTREIGRGRLSAAAHRPPPPPPPLTRWSAAGQAPTHRRRPDAAGRRRPRADRRTPAILPGDGGGRSTTETVATSVAQGGR